MALSLIAIAVIAIALLWSLPRLQLRSVKRGLKTSEITLTDYLKAENDRRVTIAQVLGGLAVLAGLFYSSRTVRLQENGQLTDRINKAVEQLGAQNLPVNLGGIHQLARIAADYDEERYPMLQVLTSFLEVKAALPSSLKVSDCDPFQLRQFDGLPTPANQAVISVLAEQIPKLDASRNSLEINHVNLSYVDFSNGHFGKIQLAGDDFTGAHFIGSHFEPQSLLASSQFIYADLSNSNFSGVRLHHACMAQTRLHDAIFSGADLSYVDFRGVEDLNGADFTGADLSRADLRGADLSQVKGLTEQQLDRITCDEFTRFPSALDSVKDKLKCADTPG